MARKRNFLTIDLLADALHRLGIGAAAVDRETLRLRLGLPNTMASSRTRRSPLLSGTVVRDAPSPQTGVRPSFDVSRRCDPNRGATTTSCGGCG